ncbi:MAG: dihydropteroate synthase [Candidatus Latescibacterota bacterium]|nr:dihydropteroate synthase [Candidatus Latescibacterota bacterium]
MNWALPRGRQLDFGTRVHIMGILNTTPDSFYDGGRHDDPSQAAERAVQMVEEGADIIDVGGESSRPPMYGEAHQVDATEEIQRVVPAIKAIRRVSDVPISVDTTKSQVALAAREAGADILNDISALDEWGTKDLDLLAGGEIPVILMHRRGTISTMQSNTHYEDLQSEVTSFLLERVARARDAGVVDIATDPGLGFGKSVDGNFLLLQNAGQFSVDGCPVLIGASRKSFLWRPMGRSPQQALAASVAAAVMGAFHGARILRVHDVAETLDALRVLEAMPASESSLNAPAGASSLNSSLVT